MAKARTLNGGIKKLKELLSDRSRWCLGSYAQDKEGKALGFGHHEPWDHPQAAKWCLVGAIHRVASGACKFKLKAHVKSKAKVQSLTVLNDCGGWRPVKKLMASL